MRAKPRSTHQIIEEQMQRWQITRSEKKEEREVVSVVTLSREPGSGGRIIAERLAKNLQYDLFDQQILHTMAESAKISAKILESLDERGLSMLDDWTIIHCSRASSMAGSVSSSFDESDRNHRKT